MSLNNAPLDIVYEVASEYSQIRNSTTINYGSHHYNIYPPQPPSQYQVEVAAMFHRLHDILVFIGVALKHSGYLIGCLNEPSLLLELEVWEWVLLIGIIMVAIAILLILTGTLS